MIGVEFTKAESKIYAFVRALSSVTKYTYLSKRQKLWVHVRLAQTCGNSNERVQRKFSLLVVVMVLLPAPSPSPRRRPRSPTPPRRSRPRSPVAGHAVSDASRRVHVHDTNNGQSFWITHDRSCRDCHSSLSPSKKMQDNKSRKSGIVNPNGQNITHQRKWSEEMRNQ